jgi:hypothetical protein
VKKFRYMTATAAVACALTIAAQARADTFTYSSYSILNPQDISISKPTSVVGEAGQITLTGSGPTNAGQSIIAWCLDVYDFLNSSGIYQIGQLTTAGVGGQNPTLTANQINEIGSLMAHGDTLLTNHNSPQYQFISAAIQVAIWTIEYGSNNFKYTTDSHVASLAQTYVFDVLNGGVWAPTANEYSVTLLSERGNQNLGYVDPTPLPAALPLFAGGLSALGLLGYWRRNRAPRSVAV